MAAGKKVVREGVTMITIELLRNLYKKDAVFLTQHVIERCKQRGIRPIQIRQAVMNGEIIEDYPEDFPHPSCLVLGFPPPGLPLHTVIGSDGKTAKVITAYYPDSDKWDVDMKKRKEK